MNANAWNNKRFSLDLDPRSKAFLAYIQESLTRLTGKKYISSALVVRRALLMLAMHFSEIMQLKSSPTLDLIKKGESINLRLMKVGKDGRLKIDLSAIEGSLPPLEDCWEPASEEEVVGHVGL